MASDDAYIIDPPVGPFSPIEDLRAWRQKLAQMPPSEARDLSLAEVDQWLRFRERNGE